LRIREWFKRGAAREDPRVRRWRESWASSEPTAERAIIARLAGELEQIGLPDEEIENEREMLQALIDRDDLACATRAGGLPFRCNSYTDALCAAFIGREILAARRTPTPGL